MPSPEPDWIGLSGWDRRYARVVFSKTVNQFGLALIDVNGDGREMSILAAVLADDRQWIPVQQQDAVARDHGQGWTPAFVYAWGYASPRVDVVVEYQGTRYLAHPDGLSWWTFIHPFDATDALEQPPTRIS